MQINEKKLIENIGTEMASMKILQWKKAGCDVTLFKF